MSEKEKSLPEETARKISNMILNEKRFKPGDRIPSEYELAHELGVSRLTVREAVKTLIANNILYIKRGVGTFVSNENKDSVNPYGIYFTKSKKEHIKDSFETRRIIEPEIVALAAERATEEDIADMLKCAENCKECLLNGGSIDDTDREFHISLAKASHNAILYRLMTTVDYEIEDSRQALYIKGNKSFDDGVLVDHFEVVRFIKESDGVGASIVMRHHLNRALEYLKNK